MARDITERTAGALDAARVSFWLYTDDRLAIECVDMFDAGNRRHSSGEVLRSAACPTYFAALERRGLNAIHDTASDPRTREIFPGELQTSGVITLLHATVAPASGSGGVLRVELSGSPRHWTADEASFALAAAGRLALAVDAAERNRLYTDLRHALAQLEQMLEHNPAVLFRLLVEDDRLVPLAIGGNLPSMLGYSAAEAKEPDWWRDGVHPEDREAALAGMTSLLAGDETPRHYRFRHKGGSYRWIEDNERVIRDESGRPVETSGLWLDVTERREREDAYNKVSQELLELSRVVGMAEVATNVVHNVGNVLNSVNVASSLLADRLRGAKAASLAKVANLLQEHEANPPAYLAEDAMRRRIPDFVNRLAAAMVAEHADAVSELRSRQNNVDHIKEIVFVQQSLARLKGTTGPVAIGELVEQGLRMAGSDHRVHVARELEPVPQEVTDKHLVLQKKKIRIHLLRNAKDACLGSTRRE